MELASFKPNTDARVSFELRSATGMPITTPVQVRWRLLDAAEAILADWSTPEAAVGTFEVIVPASHNVIAPGDYAATRVIELEADDGAAVLVAEKVYFVEEALLQPWVNTAVSYFDALRLSRDLTPEQVNAWLDVSGRAERSRRLAAAWTTLLMTLPIKVRGTSAHRGCLLRALTPSERAIAVQTDPELVTAMGHAQVLEASAAAAADPVTEARRNGVVSMTVGESSQFFGNAQPLLRTLYSRDAAQVLGRWVDFSLRIGRT